MSNLRRLHRVGFTLVEILIVVIILGILAAIVIPQFSHATEDSRKANMRNQLQTLRSTIQLFRLEHRDALPLLTTNGWDVFTEKTDVTGAVSAAGTFGPYLPHPPRNPLTNSDTIANAAGVGVGWVYNETTGDIHGVRADGAQSDTGD